MKKTSKKKMEYRMYYLVMYNISPIQQGIQALHATVEYANKFGNTEEYKKWSKKDKTVVILNGGTSTDPQYDDEKGMCGTMEEHLKWLKANKIPCVPFYEPDLNYSLSAICFLVPENIFNAEPFKHKGITYTSETLNRYSEAWYLYRNYEKDMGGKGNVDFCYWLKKFRRA